MNFKLIYLFSLISLINCQAYPEISFISKEKVVNIGDTVQIQCAVQYARDYPVEFIKLNKKDARNYLFISKGTTVNIPDSRYQVEYNSQNHTYTLSIEKVQELDTGLYACQIVAGLSNKVKAEVWLFVRIPPVIFDNSTRHVITSTGLDVKLDCYATGFPLPIIFWRREKGELISNSNAAFFRGNSLQLTNVTKNDRGSYYCVADNGVASGSRRAISVEVEFKPYVKVGRPRYGQALNHEIVLHCHVEAFPSPTIQWIKDGQSITNNQNFYISIFSTSDEFTSTTLKVKRIEKKNYGSYLCKASNKLGSSEAEIQLFETANIICPPACDTLQSPFSNSNQLTSTFNLIHLTSIIIILHLSTHFH